MQQGLAGSRLFYKVCGDRGGRMIIIDDADNLQGMKFYILPGRTLLSDTFAHTGTKTTIL